MSSFPPRAASNSSTTLAAQLIVAAATAHEVVAAHGVVPERAGVCVDGLVPCLAQDLVVPASCIVGHAVCIGQDEVVTTATPDVIAAAAGIVEHVQRGIPRYVVSFVATDDVVVAAA